MVLVGALRTRKTGPEDAPPTVEAMAPIFAQMVVGLAAADVEEKTVMVDATCLKADRRASSVGVSKGAVDA